MPMVRWIAFDDETAEAIVSRFKRGAAEIHEGNPLDEALRLGKATLILPSDTPGKVLFARLEVRNDVKKNVKNDVRSEVPSGQLVGYEPTGFLGLADEPVFTRPPQPATPPKKKWWQRKSA
jgi:hypothetical protein